MALFEAFSSMKTVNNLDDFDQWARKMIKGGEIEGKQQTGALIRELQGVMTHSILSGPKTPARAIIGTSCSHILTSDSYNYRCYFVFTIYQRRTCSACRVSNHERYDGSYTRII